MTTTPPGAYPEHEKMRLIVDQSQAIGEFIEWLGDVQDISLCYSDRNAYWPTGKPIMWLLAEFFEIDLQKIAEEKAAMLAAVRGGT